MEYIYCIYPKKLHFAAYEQLCPVFVATAPDRAQIRMFNTY